MSNDELCPCIMFQGTSSDAGKSVLATALCRILANMGYKVAPFKAQNMANNSYVTEEGHEIGRAQGAQAEASKAKAEASMNPILLKPSSDGASQVVVMGKALEEVKAKEYRENWVPYLWPKVQEALYELRKKYDFVVMEGAGSPAEVNLRERDLTNMEVAGEGDARVVLVSDVEKGGMLASVVGTLELLEDWERDLVYGIVVNKFRGDYKLLEPGLDFLEKKTGKRVLGVIPYFTEELVEAEDSLSLSRKISSGSDGMEGDKAKGKIKVGVVNLSRISNFTDFDPLEQHPEIEFKYLPLEKEIDDIDCLILPGTKASRQDLINFMESKLYSSIKENNIFEKKPIMGVCGGYQMLGNAIKDYEGIEGRPGELEGLELLPLVTEFIKDKCTVRVSCRVTSKNNIFAPIKDENITGYEIHLGNTRVLDEDYSWLYDEKNNSKGAISKDSRILGTYLHDIFDNEKFLQWFLAWVKSWKYSNNTSRIEEFYFEDNSGRLSKEENYDKLAEIVKENLDIDSLLDGMIKK
ncbi:cobyric acid synthase [Natranaerofaba carboxydovora]|uniref:cobyric acid synthase n=1 Tax=Natranaerofaba carboxydovora TaxID=2742683 RepID=UPI001F130C2A|nr:cobyric acid synthase [Natranaerofaba carboxydovora]UMZ73149.1 Cobyric acid synthase [Natranaerofaba carboxydovora]